MRIKTRLHKLKKTFKIRLRPLIFFSFLLLIAILGLSLLQLKSQTAFTATQLFKPQDSQTSKAIQFLQTQDLSFVSKATDSQSIIVESKIIAEKLNLERKMIVPKSPSQISQIESVVKEHGGKIIQKKQNLIIAEIPKETEEATKLTLESTNSVETLEVDYPTYLAADNPDWGVVRIEAPKVWPTTTAEGIKIAVIDSGIDYTHQDLRGRYAGGYDTYNEDGDPFDDHGHGTHVAGTIASEMNDMGTIGVAPKASIYALKALGWTGTGYTSDIVEAIDWAMANGAQVMNFSLGSSYDSTILRNKINEAAGKGIYLVAAAGNTHGGPLMYPAAYGNVISVSATDSNNLFASFSSLGAEIAAPGVATNSTFPGNRYVALSGTSMAAPHVTATIALMIANNQTNIRENLHNTAIDLGPAGKDAYFGYGLINAKNASLGKDTLAPVVTFLSPDNNANAWEQVKVELNVQDENAITEVDLTIDNQIVKKWTQPPYTYLWDTTNIEKRTYTLLAQATDSSGNIGAAKISVIVSSIPPSTPSITPVSPLSPIPTRGGSEEHRQDVNSPAEEHRQNYEQILKNIEKQMQKKEQQSSKEDTSEVTNINSRNPKSTNFQVSTDSKQKEKSLPTPEQSKKDEKNKSSGGEKGKVKGLSFPDSSFWTSFLRALFGTRN